MKYNSHAIQFSHLKYTIISFYYIHRFVQSSPKLILDDSHHPLKKCHTHCQSFFISPQLPAITNLLYVSVDLPILDFPSKWNLLICCLL